VVVPFLGPATKKYSGPHILGSKGHAQYYSPTDYVADVDPKGEQKSTLGQLASSDEQHNPSSRVASGQKVNFLSMH